jgi:hypothetical protein
MQKTKPNRVSSEYVFRNPHIDPLTKAMIVTMLRAKEDTIAELSEASTVGTLASGLKNVSSQIDIARADLHDLCQISDAHILADLYHELTTVADKIYRLAYQKERN